MSFKIKITLILIIFFIGLSSASFASAAITYFGSASNPADNGTLATSPVSVTPPTNMQYGDLVILAAHVRDTTTTMSMSATAGQTWTSETQYNGTADRMMIFWCRFNGSWFGDPGVSMGATNNTLVMHVFRLSENSNVAVDVALASGGYAAPSTPFTVTIPSVTTNTDGALVLAFWGSADDNTWGSLTSGWSNMGDAQYRNLAGNPDSSYTGAYKIQTTAGSTGSVSKNQATLGGDAGVYMSIAFKEIPAIKIYRSVAPGATSALGTDSSHANTVSITSGVATFSATLPDNIGVGDALIIDTGGTDQAIDSSDTLLFIHGRTDSTNYTVRTHTGAVPANIASNDTYSIYRAYTSLFNAEAGTKNTSIPITFNGGNRNLTTVYEQWHIACYANGTTADTTDVTFSGWTTNKDNYIKVYTPLSISEVGVSQRHSGKWSADKYRLEVATSSFYSVCVIVEGLQISASSTSFFGGATLVRVSSNIIKGAGGISLQNIPVTYGSAFVYNNIIYNATKAISLVYGGAGGGNFYIFNNTIYNCNRGIDKDADSEYIKNNIIHATDAFYVYLETFTDSDTVNDYNAISENNSTDVALGTNGKYNQTFNFVSTVPGEEDLHLLQSDTVARGAGANLTNDPYFPFATDIDGQLRNPAGAGWDIGADEGTKEFVSTVMQSGGNFSSLSSWEDAVDSDLVASTTRVFSHGGITGTIVGGNTVLGATSGATATVIYATSTQILLSIVSGIFQSGEVVQIGPSPPDNYCTISDNGNPASAVAKIDGAWSSADTTAVSINGWVSGSDNYIKIYTNTTAKHSGKWDATKYILDYTAVSTSQGSIGIYEDFVRIEGLQIKITDGNYNYVGGIHINNLSSGKNELKISNNIIRAGTVTNTETAGINNYFWDTNSKLFNNIVYGFTSGTGIRSRGNAFVYNNTIFNSKTGIFQYDGALIAKNNIYQSNGISSADGYSGTFDSSSDYNISNLASDAPSPSYNSGLSATVLFISTTSGSEDLHLSQSDTSAKNAGTDLSAYFTTDIEGNPRNSSMTAWDIGADETSTQIFRSVGPSATGALANDNSHANTVTLTSGVATFSTSLADNIGVGDAVIIDTGGTDQSIDASDTLLFIHKRNSSTSYDLRTHTGTIPSNISSNDTYQIYRAHTSLSNAESGTKNTSIPMAFNGGNRDLVVNNEEWNIACYANGTTADSTKVNISDWTTGAQNFIKIYAPLLISEVGNSQRHNGKWDNYKYNMSFVVTTTNDRVIELNGAFVRIDGLQIYITNNTTLGYATGILALGSGDVYVSNNIIKATAVNSSTVATRGIFLGDAVGHHFAWNNIIYGFNATGGTENSAGIYSYGRSYVFNNTVFDSKSGIKAYEVSNTYLINNITQNCTDGYIGSFHSTSDYNISDLASDAPGSNSKNSTNVQFIDRTNFDFHLSQSDTSAKNAGTDLSAYFTNDIDGSLRNVSISAWDIGADETATQIFRSVGPGATGALATDSSHANTVTLSSGVATFSTALADNIGVGDAVIVDTGGTDQAIDASDTLLFISGRTDSTHYALKTHTGSIPNNISSNDTYQVYRAYTSLANAEAGTKNTSIPITFNGGNRDLVANNEEWYISCYANGVTADSTNFEINDWVIGYLNYLKIYTPVSSVEVGVSQRHSGKWDENKYLFRNSGKLIQIRESNVIIDGLQINNNVSAGNSYNILNDYSETLSNIRISNNILTKSGAGNGTGAIWFNSSSNNNFQIFNNIMYDWDGTALFIQSVDNGTYLYNNTVYNSGNGYYTGTSNDIIATNNIAQNCTDGFVGTFSASSNYNISDLSSDAPSTAYRNGLATDVIFVNETSRDLHLHQTDSLARQAGTNLTADAYLKITTDIDGQLRNPSGIGWDIGADEGTKEFVTTVMQTGGNFASLNAWEDAIDSDLVANTTRVFSHGGITGTIVGGNTVTGVTSGATATVIYATSTQILLSSVSGVFQTGETIQVSAGNSVVISENGNPASIVAKIDGAWTVVDTTAVNINGWITGPDNYIKIYTTEASRHKGKWDEKKYIISDQSPVFIVPDNVTIDGLQVKSTNYNGIAFNSGGDYYLENNTLSNNIVTCTLAIPTHQGITVNNPYNANNIRVFNNIVYNFNIGFYIGASYPSTNFTVANNTAYGNESTGIRIGGNGLAVKNNISVNNTQDYEMSNKSPLYSNNISSDSTAPGSSGSKINTDVKFISTGSGSEDFHLHPDDRFAKDAGADLSAYFTNDIDGIPRPPADGWDIGADELPTQIYRSVGPSATGLLASDNSHANTVTLASGSATFSASVPDNIGVGDVVIIDTNNDNSITSADTLLFIHKRNDGMSYELRNQTGTIPANIANNDTYQIYRAYTSLSNAEAGTINSTLSGMGFTFNGGNRDLITNNEQWNIACYANGTTADTTSTTVDGWITGENNFIKIYTPVGLNEVGVSQRHDGRNDSVENYKISNIASLSAIYLYVNYVVVEGIEISNYGSVGYSVAAINLYNSNYSFISHNLIYDEVSGNNGYAISIPNYGYRGSKIFNNIIYNVFTGIRDNRGDNNLVYIYNNTISSCSDVGIYSGAAGTLVKNNIVQNCADGYSGTFNASSDYNISDLAADAPGGNSKNSTNVLFIDEANNNFCLDYDDTAARGAGLNFSNDTILPFSDDIRGQARPKSPEAWSIGACESQSAGKVKMENDIKMEGSLKFE